jgi:hypothetical protein
MMQSCGNLSADNDSVEGSSYKDISESTLKNFLYERYAEECKKAGIAKDILPYTGIGSGSSKMILSAKSS